MAFSFGATPAASSAPSGFSFGANTAAPAAPSSFNFNLSTPSTPSPFNTSTTTPAATGFGFFGAQQPAPQAVGPPITLETTFEALPKDVQKNMTQFHMFLKEQDQLDTFLKKVSPHQMTILRENMTRLEQEVLARRNRQDRQTAAVQHLRQDVRQLLHQVDAATLSRRSLDNSSNDSASNLYHVMRRVEMPSPYYWKLLDHYEQKMAAIKAQIEDVEAQLKPVNTSTANAIGLPAPAQLQQILLAQNTALMQAAARVAEVHEKAEEMRQLFLAKMKEDLARHGENPAAFQNPFDKRKKSSEVDKRDAIDKIRFRTSVAPTIVTPQPVAAAPAATPSLFGFGTATPAAAPAPAPAPASGFSFGASSAPAKSVSFNLGSATSMAPLTTTASVTAAPFPAGSMAAAPAAGGFTAPTVATSGFGSITSSFLPPASADGKTSVGSKRGSGRAHKKR
ncbi:unnamed protein product [Peronospora farinosa]|uniref:Nucleoporin Nup54 alpha-helical domain-containing protein n=1 Tax=Peronospora farinosa TaxID=134698 RepID=A0AAV0T7K2_9STRA|nr:unnamed protein product [Peronospora farinosa]CAI5715615.1 unnamed protein product [Peronospora farinosa]